MRVDDAGSRIAYWLSVAVGLVLEIVPLPHWADPWRPDIALMLVIFWVLARPRIAGLGYAWLAGLLLDVLRGMVLGQHALGFLVVAYIAHRLQLRMRMFPLPMQAGAVLMLLAAYHFIIFWTDGLTGHGNTGWAQWLPVFSGALFWPLVVAAGDTMTRRSR